MYLRAPAILLATRAHGENGVVVRMLTHAAGLVPAYVAGGRGRRMRPVVLPGNLVAAEVRARSDSQLPFARLELSRSRAPWLAEPLPAAAIAWACALTASVLPERQPYSPIYFALDALLEAIVAAPSARGWLPGFIAFERLLLRDLGYGRSRFPVPDEVADQLALFDRQGRAIAHHLLADYQQDVMASREVLIGRLRRMLS